MSIVCRCIYLQLIGFYCSTTTDAQLDGAANKASQKEAVHDSFAIERYIKEKDHYRAFLAGREQQNPSGAQDLDSSGPDSKGGLQCNGEDLKRE